MPPDIFDSLIPAEEYDLRLETIIQIRDEHRRKIADETRELTILEFCYLISMSLSDLQGLARIARISYVVIRHLFDHMVELTDRFFRDGPKIQNEGEKAKCLDFDHGVCIITGAPDPHVCHIVPFAGHEMNKYASIGAMDSSDKIWNMMCLSPLLHDWWARGYFALKFHGENPNDDGTSSIQLQFFWMPSYIRRGSAMDPINLKQQQDPHTRLAAFLTYPHGENSPTCSPEDSCLMGAEAKQVANHKPVSTGAIFTVTRPTADVPHFRCVINTQWAVICAASLSGRIRDPEVLLSRRGLGLEAPSGLDEWEILERPENLPLVKRYKHNKET